MPGAVRQPPERGDDLLDRLPQLGVAGERLAGRAALDQHRLAVRLLHGRLVEYPLRPAGLAGIVAVGVAGAEMLSDRECRDDDQQPADDNDDAVPDRPAGYSFDDRRMGSHPRGLCNHAPKAPPPQGRGAMVKAPGPRVGLA